jgi:hypothetical protein
LSAGVGGTNAGDGSISTGGASAIANFGGGGGGGGSSGNTPGGNGGSGVVIIRYPIGTANCSGGTITNAGGFTIHTFTSSGTFTVA